jgi:PqqD family protein of HPr-rel-A system
MRELVSFKWRISKGFNLRIRNLTDQHVIYHCGSGDTHLLDFTGFFVFKQLNVDAYSFEQLLQKLTNEFEFESSDESKDYLSSLLTEFEKLALVERLDT